MMKTETTHQNGGQPHTVSILNELLKTTVGLVDLYDRALDRRPTRYHFASLEDIRRDLNRRLGEMRLWVVAFGGRPANAPPDEPRWTAMQNMVSKGDERTEVAVLSRVHRQIAASLDRAVDVMTEHPLAKTLRRFVKAERTHAEELGVEIRRLRASESVLD